MVGHQKSGPRLIFAVRSAINLEDVIRITGRGRQAGVLEAIGARREPAADFLGPMSVRDDRQLVLVRFVHDRLHFLRSSSGPGRSA